MDLDYYNEDEELNEAIASMDISASAGIKEGDITQKKDPILTVRVAVNINHQEKILFIQVFNDTKCIDWLMEQVAQKVWESYGYEPKIYELKTEASGCLLPQELVVVAIQGNFELVHAYYHGFREKTPLEVYQNSCSRNKVSTRHTVELALHENEQTDALVLADTCLVSRDIPVICDLLSHIKPVTKVDLSGNVLYDHDIADLFKHIQDLHEVDLSSNRITSKTIAKLAYHPNLRRASLSYNPLGSDTLALLPELLRKCSHLDVLDLESCDVDNYTLQDITLHEYRHYSGHRLESLNLSNNALIRDSTSFERWKPLLHNLVNHPTNIEF
ncbi:hypothetical protein BDA99DRAFT_24619 [Phascolomyces articulosus]|uniref:Uncharacterized protein n=1 Tax=Phascolomyces articulosus TaxID=60185 RepID=A0AAD5KCR2_9FUNG|nr:hypothetical protein BDA99DRAFT_24619 [Phascolomyces articulosus]